MNMDGVAKDSLSSYCPQAVYHHIALRQFLCTLMGSYRNASYSNVTTVPHVVISATFKKFRLFLQLDHLEMTVLGSSLVDHVYRSS